MGAWVMVMGFLAWTARADTTDVNTLVEQALVSNPSIQALVARTEALQVQVATAGARPDPVLGVEYSQAPLPSLSISDHAMSGVQLRAQQVFKPPGWSRLQRDLAALRADGGAAATAEARVRLTAAVHTAFWSLARVHALEALTQAHLARTEELLAAVNTRYEVGATGQHAVLRLQVLSARLRDELDEFTRLDTELTAGLNAAIGAAPETRYTTPPDIAAIDAPKDQDWIAIATAHRPRLAQLETARQESEVAGTLARLDGKPDVQVWAGYRLRTVETHMDDGEDLVSVGVGVPIPSGSARRARSEQAAQLAESRGQGLLYDALINDIHAEMQTITARWRRSWRKARTYESTLIPAAQATLDTTLSDFTVGRAEFASLFDAEVTLLDLERARIHAATDTHLQQAAAWATLGTAPAGAAQPVEDAP